MESKATEKLREELAVALYTSVATETLTLAKDKKSQDFAAMHTKAYSQHNIYMRNGVILTLLTDIYYSYNYWGFFNIKKRFPLFFCGL
jgi:hypothetical protein